MEKQFRETNLITVAEARKLSGALIYALCDDEGEAFYVGQTRRPNARFNEHATRKGGLNAWAAARYADLGEYVRVSILRVEPKDLNEAECEEIARRPWTQNVVVPGHFRWKMPHITQPWMFGNTCPSKYVLKRLQKAKMDCNEEREAILRVHPDFRFHYEIEIYCDMDPTWRARIDEWAQSITMIHPDVPHLLWHKFLIAHGEAKASAAYMQGFVNAMKIMRGEDIDACA